MSSVLKKCHCSDGCSGESRSCECLMSSNVTAEGCRALDESGAICNEIETLNILKAYREEYDKCLKRVQESCIDCACKEHLKELTQLTEDVWAQNTMLAETVEELELMRSKGSMEEANKQETSDSGQEIKVQLDLEKEQHATEVRDLQVERDALTERVNELTETMKEIDESFKETRWALTAEVAEKHDQIVELRKCVSVLEEQLRQADMQTHFKDDIIKDMRKELKTAKKQEHRGLYDVVTELKAVQRHDSLQNMNDQCKESPQDKLDLLRQTLRQRINDMELQEEMTRELESDLQETRKDLQVLQDKYHSMECQQQSADGEVNSSKRCQDEDVQDAGAEIRRLQHLSRWCCKRLCLGDLQELTDIAACEMQLLKQIEQNTDGIFNYLHQVRGEGAVVEEEKRVRLVVAEVEDTHRRLQEMLEGVFRGVASAASHPSCPGDDAGEDQAPQTNSNHACVDRSTSPMAPSVEEVMERLHGRVKMFADRLKDCDDETTSGGTCSVHTAAENEHSCGADCGKVEQLSEKLLTQQQLISNKEETLHFLQDNLRMRESQNEALRFKIQDLEAQVQTLTQGLEEKSRDMCDLQQTVHQQKQYEFQISVRDEQIESLQLDVCDLELKIRVITKEIVQRTRLVEKLRDENVDLRSDICGLHQDTCVMEAELKKTRRQREMEEKKNSQTRQELEAREKELNNLQRKVKRLETDIEGQEVKWEKQACEDATTISQLERDVTVFQQQLRNAHESFDERLADAELRIMQERKCACERLRKLNGKNMDMSHAISQLTSEVHMLREKEKDMQAQQDMNAKVSELEGLLRQSEARREAHDEKINKLHRVMEKRTLENDLQRNALEQQLEVAKCDDFKNRSNLTKLSETIRNQAQTEKNLKDYLEHYSSDLEILRQENVDLKVDLEARLKQIADEEVRTREQSCELGKYIGALQSQKTELKARACAMRRDLEEEVKAREKLEEDLAQVQESLAQKMTELNTTRGKLQDTLQHLRELEEELMRQRDDAAKKDERLEAVEDVVEELQKAVKKERREKQCLEQQLQDKEHELMRLAGVIETHEVEVADLRRETYSLESSRRKESKQLEVQVDVARRTADVLEVEVCRLRKQLAEATEREASMRAELAARKQNWSFQLHELQQEKTTLEKKLTCREQHLEESVKELDHVTEQLRLTKLEADKNIKKLLYKMNRSDEPSQKTMDCLRSKVQYLSRELSQCQHQYENLNMNRQTDTEKLMLSDKMRVNYEKLLTQINTERMTLEDENSGLLEELYAVQQEVKLLKEKIAADCRAAAKEKDALAADNGRVAVERSKLKSQLEDVSTKVAELEKRHATELEAVTLHLKQEVRDLETQLSAANASCDRMRSEAESVAANSKKCLMQQKNANENLNIRIKILVEEKTALANEMRALDERTKGLVRMNEYLISEAQRRDSRLKDGREESSSHTSPWAITRSHRDASPDLLESGFQSMQPSPTDMFQDGFMWGLDEPTGITDSDSYPSSHRIEDTTK